MKTEEVLASIREGKKSREQAIQYLYANEGLRNGIKKVLRNEATESEFQEIFNMTLVGFMKKVLMDRDFHIQSNLHSYLFVIARNLWIQKKRKEKNKPTPLSDKYNILADQEIQIDVLLSNQENHEQLKTLLSQMGRNCYEVLWHWAAGYNMNEIADKLSYKSAEVARRKKYRCMKRVMAYVKNHNWVKDLLRV